MRKGPSAKKIYRAPALRVYGNIRELTFTVTNKGTVTDAISMAANKTH